MMSYLATIFLIGLLIFVHELGHLLAAQCVGIPVARFSIGFGPVLWRRTFRSVEYCLSLVPLGGYVMPKCDDEAEFTRIPVARRVVMWLGGPLANILLAVPLVALLNYLAGGFSWYGQFVEPWLQVARQSADFVAMLGVLLTHPDHLSGIVGIVAIGRTVIDSGLASALKFAVLLNLNLAVFNLLPIPPLDGGKIVFSLLEKIHPRLARLQTGFALAGLAMLLVLMLYTTVMDVVRQLA
jgi:regulator of sigma E protease